MIAKTKNGFAVRIVFVQIHNKRSEWLAVLSTDTPFAMLELFEYSTSAEALSFFHIGHVAASPCKRVPLQQLRCARRTHHHCLFTVLVDGVGKTAESESPEF